MARSTRSRNLAVAAALAVTLAASLTGCGGASGGGDQSKILTYWASQQSPSIERDKEILQPELDKFAQQTGIKVELEVIPFTQLLTKILTATTSGQGPDVVNIGNTWTPSLQATGAFKEWDAAMMDKVGGTDRFEPAALATTGLQGKTPVAVPLYNKVYQLYYNKSMFKEAGISKPPATWDEFVTTGKKLTKDTNGDGTPDQWGLSVRGQASTVAVQYAYILGSARGAQYFDGDTPTFDSPPAVDGIDQYLSWMGKDKIVNPSDAESADWADVYASFAGNKAGMMIVQTLGATLQDYKLTDKDYGVAPMPASTVPGSKDIGSFVGGTNVGIFDTTKNEDGAIELVKFLTNSPEQTVINTAYGTLPAVKDAKGPAFDTAEMKIARDTIANRAIPMPQAAQETQFETLVGTAVVSWLADTATGKQPDTAQISTALKAAGDKVKQGG